MTLRRLLRARRHGGRAHARGVAALELAILMVPLVIMTFGMAELGRAFFYYNSVVKTVRTSVRYLSMQTPGTGETQAKCLAVYGTVSCGDTPVVRGLSTSMVKVDYETGVETGYGTINLVKVTVDGLPFEPIMGVPIDAFNFGPIACEMRQVGPS